MADYTEEIIIDTTVKGAEQAEKQLDKLADATKDANDAGDEYTETLGGLAKEVEIFGVSINGMVGAFKNSIGAIKNSVKSLNALKIAVASTGIPLLVIALGSLVAWLTKSQQGMNFLNDAMAVVGATVDEIIGVFTKFGSALVKLFKGDFKGAFNDASKAMDGFVDNIKQAVKDTLALEQAIRNLQIATANASVITSAYNQEIAKNKQVIENVNASTSERIKLAERNLDLIKIIGETEETNAFQALENERDRVNSYNKANGLQKTRIEDQEILRQLESELIDIGTASEERQIEFLNKLNELRALEQQEWLEWKSRQINATETQTTQEFQQLNDVTVATADELGKRLQLGVQFYKDKEKQRKADELLARQQASLELSLVADLYGAMANIAGQDSAIGKALAISQATINTYQGITATLARPIPLAQKILEIGIVSATGFGAVKDIIGTPIPSVSINTSTPFGDGGMIHGNSHAHASGGTWVLAEGGEAVINKRSMSIPWIRKQASYLNTIGGGVPFMERGGVVPDAGVNPFVNIERAMSSAQTVLVLDDLDRAQQGEFATRVTTTL